MAVWDYEKDKYNSPNGEDRYKRKLVHIDAYGAVNTKILVRIASPLPPTQKPWTNIPDLLNFPEKPQYIYPELLKHCGGNANL